MLQPNVRQVHQPFLSLFPRTATECYSHSFLAISTSCLMTFLNAGDFLFSSIPQPGLSEEMLWICSCSFGRLRNKSSRAHSTPPMIFRSSRSGYCSGTSRRRCHPRSAKVCPNRMWDRSHTITNSLPRPSSSMKPFRFISLHLPSPFSEIPIPTHRAH